MLTELCGYLRNYFEKAKFFGKFEIKNGVLISFNDGDMGLLDGQYIRIVGSVLNDGVYQYYADGIKGLSDETFEGAVWSLAIPKAVVKIADKISAWKKKYEGVISSPFSNENQSASSYGYTKTSADSIGKISWKSVFASDLAQWRKI